ncbi:hypothetical protein K402DRAFT_462683 [Aulographum hederae CBS 113979]|uniref:Transmembrane protein n=1 Tax=Aulographum hederae CBS 113979 TaxID=1176131 RepID=A0A6G1H4E9_9PEZI|nr:hypothetical protein K402DRAFT_462683 [Aulographum hederae CBS 113979]
MQSSVELPSENVLPPLQYDSTQDSKMDYRQVAQQSTPHDANQPHNSPASSIHENDGSSKTRRSSFEMSLLSTKQQAGTRRKNTNNQRPHHRAKRLGLQLHFWVSAAYLLALLVAAGNAILFWKLEGKRPDQTISQDYQTNVANLMAMLFEMSLLYAVGVAYTQQVWSTFRSQAIEVATIDALLALPRTPWGVFNFTIFKRHFIEWIFGVFCLGVPIAVTFPPSALIVQPFPWPEVQNFVHVPTVDLDTLGFDSKDQLDATYFPTGSTVLADGSGSSSSPNMQQFLDAAIFITDYDMYYIKPKPQLRSIAQMSILSGRDIAPSLPRFCISNCTYSTIIVGPQFSCSLIDPNQAIANASAGDVPGTFDGTYVAVDIPFPVGARDYFEHFIFRNSFQISWFPEGPPKYGGAKPIQAMECITALATYSITTNFTFGAAHIQDYKVISTAPWNASNFGSQEMTFLELRDVSKFDPDRFLLKLQRTSAFAIRDAAVETLLGRVVLQAGGARIIENTTQILGTQLANLDVPNNRVLFNITPTAIEDLLRNATFSVMSLEVWNATTNATLYNWQNVYAFTPQANLYAPYGACLLVGAMLILVGGWRLRRNGVAANDGFMQVLCTTQASARVRDVAVEGGLGDNEELPEGIREMRVRYGEIVGRVERGEGEEHREVREGVKRRVGFGFPDEVRGLM